MTHILTDRAIGQVYTPNFLADWVAELVSDKIPNTGCPTILDPACGDGELLVAAQNIFENGILIGVDIDPQAISQARQRLTKNTSLIVSNVLNNPFQGKNGTSNLLGEIDVIISNPPWGVNMRDWAVRDTKNGYVFATGQFDSWCLFVELSLKILNCNGVAIFILPDSILSPEFSRVRRLLVNHYTIDLIARLGEGMFPNIYRGTVVIALRKTIPEPNHRIEIVRLTKRDRKSVTSGSLPISYFRSLRHHFTSQSQYLADPNIRWDIDVRERERKIIDKIEESNDNWSSLFKIGRGVEISKTGKVRYCETCRHVIPEPRKHRVIKCKRCGITTDSEVMPQRTVVSQDSTQLRTPFPLIVGEDVKRYTLTTTRFLELNVDGINYKNFQTYSTERMLVRKTGIGINATITRKLAATNQVVFHVIPNPGVEAVYLPYVLGVLSSRLIFAYHLKKNGEIEWRSHPYITPTVLRQFPIPIPKKGTKRWKLVERVSNCVQSIVEGTDRIKELDLEIEDHVASLYGLTGKHRTWVSRVILDAQQLKPMRSLMT